MSIEKEIYHLQNHVVILGYNDRVERIVQELNGEGLDGESCPVLIVADVEHCPAAKHKQVHHFQANPSKEDTLKQIKLDQAKAILVVANEASFSGGQSGSVDAQTVLTVINLQRYFSLFLANFKVKPRVIAECMEENTLEHLKNAGCDEIVMIGSTSAALLAASVINPGITKFFGEVFSTLFGHEFYIADPPEKVIGYSFLQALKWIKVTYGDILVAVKRGSYIWVNPRRFVMEKGDKVVVLARFKPNYNLQNSHVGYGREE